MTSVLAVCRPVDRPAWFPDWTGQPCAIIASGPSAKRTKVDLLRGRFRVIAIKEVAVDLAPWADVAYGCDAAWWIHRQGLPKFSGIKVAWEDRVATHFRDVRLIRIRETAKSTRQAPDYLHRILVDEPGVIGGGRGSAFQAINLAVQFGASRIALIGIDLTGSHYYGRNNWFKAGNPDEQQFDLCRKAYELNAPVLKSLGVDVVNLSPVSRINGFRNSTIEKIVSEW